MTSLGQFCLLVALVGSGYAAFACMIGGRGGPRLVVRSGVWAAAASILALTTAVVLLAQALIVKDFRFQYVTEYSDALLPWHYSLSAFWVGQGGSLLLWAWFVAALAIVYRFAAGRRGQEFRDLAFGTLMAYLCFLVTIMVFAADPMQPSLVARHTGDGLSPLLQHPAMLFHPPIIFLGYAAWGVPFALAVAALLSGRLDNTWTEQARPWAIFAWVTLGGGILWGAAWAYEELGWGGYWSWDPVENGSLIPWLTGTALVHGLMTWRCRGALKKTTLSLAIATFALCNFATFLTRSGVFSSLHAFSQSPIGWMFLAWIVVVTAGHAVLMILRRAALGAERPLTSVWSREAFVLIGIVALVLLASMAILGTLAAPLSGVFCTARIVVGIAFYNHVLIPVGLILLTAMAATPLLRWGSRPAVAQRKMLALAAVAGAAAAVAFAAGLRHPLALAVAALAGSTVVSTAAALLLDARARRSQRSWIGLPAALAANRRRYAAYLMHFSVVCLAIGVTGSSLGSRRRDVAMAPGETIRWAGRSVRYLGLNQRRLPDKVVVEARLEVSDGGVPPYLLLPADSLYRLQNQWSSQVAVHSAWSGDFYTILHGGNDGGKVNLTLIDNPLMRWLWSAGWISVAGALAALWPLKRRPGRPAKPEIRTMHTIRGARRLAETG